MATLTGTAAGTLTLTAMVQGVSVNTPVTIVAGSLSEGTTQWSVPTDAGMVPKQIVTGVPVPGGPSMFSVSGNETETLVQAFTHDGLELWRNWLPVSNGNTVTDPYGGLLVTLFNSCPAADKMRIMNIDGPTGVPMWEIVGVSNCTSQAPQFAFRPDGVVVIASPGNTSGLPGLMMVDNLTGAILSTPTIPSSTFTAINGTTFQGYSRIGPPMVDPEGITYMEYEVRHVAYPPQVLTSTLWVMKIVPSGAVTHIQLTTTNTDTNLFPGKIIPDGFGGVVATWTFSPSQPPADANPLRAAHVTAGGSVSEYVLPIQPAEVLWDSSANPINPLLVLGSNGTAYASYGSNLARFNMTTGSAVWAYSPGPSPIAIVAAHADGVVATVKGLDGLDTPKRFDLAGAVSSEGWSGNNVNYVAGNLWTGMANAGLDMRIGGSISFDSAYAAALQKPSGTGTPLLLVTNHSNTGAQQTTITETLDKIEVALGQPVGAKCAAWYQTAGVSAVTILNVWTPEQNYGYGEFNAPHNDKAAFAGTRNNDGDPKVPNSGTPTGVPTDWVFTINKNNAFYNSSTIFNGKLITPLIGPRQYKGPSLRARATILLHELAHIMHVPNFLPDLANPAQGPINDGLIDTNCRTMIEALQ